MAITETSPNIINAPISFSFLIVSHKPKTRQGGVLLLTKLHNLFHVRNGEKK